MSLFSEQGYAATSLSQIAEAAGVSRTTLFSYFPAKRDLVWEELDASLEALPGVFEEQSGRPVIDDITTALSGLTRPRGLDRETLVVRWRMVQSDPELRSYTLAESERVTDLLVSCVTRLRPDSNARLVDHVVRALTAVSRRSIDEWCEHEWRSIDLDAYTRAQLAPLASALAPLLA